MVDPSEAEPNSCTAEIRFDRSADEFDARAPSSTMCWVFIFVSILGGCQYAAWSGGPGLWKIKGIRVTNLHDAIFANLQNAGLPRDLIKERGLGIGQHADHLIEYGRAASLCLDLDLLTSHIAVEVHTHFEI